MHIFVAFLILLVMSVISLFNNVYTPSGVYVENPILRMIYGTLIILVAGVLSLAAGVLGTLPVILLLTGNFIWAGIVFALQIFLYVFMAPEMPIIIKIPIGIFIFWVGGAAALMFGAILVSPIILLFIVF